MKAFLLEVALLSLVVLVIMSVKFRSDRARRVLRFARNVGWVYVALVLVLAIVQLAVQ